jgi:MOSC domain-containing protein YiiM
MLEAQAPLAFVETEDAGALSDQIGGWGTIGGIARHAAPGAPMEVLDRVRVAVAFGIEGDHRGRLKPSGKRQVSLIERRDWLAACAEIGVVLPWEQRRVNLLVDTLDLPQTPGTRLRVGDVLLEVTMECDPCQRMDEIAPGLQEALRPGWRGGVLARVLEDGEIAVGDRIVVEG